MSKRPVRETPVLDVPIRPNKAELLRSAISKHHVVSFADLGGCWGVNAGYTLDAMSKTGVKTAYVADQFVTPLSLERGAAHPGLKFVQGFINRQTFIDDFPEVDALVMFDILLHQVDLDWDEFLAAWSTKTRTLIIYNQMWTKDPTTVRFVDRGRDWYKANVVYRRDETLDAWFNDLDGFDALHGRKKRDIHVFWQWGITRNDLIAHVEKLGFRLDYFQDYGPFAGREWIPNQGFVFVRA